jgi:hypothetical protein
MVAEQGLDTLEEHLAAGDAECGRGRGMQEIRAGAGIGLAAMLPGGGLYTPWVEPDAGAGPAADAADGIRCHGPAACPLPRPSIRPRNLVACGGAGSPAPASASCFSRSEMRCCAWPSAISWISTVCTSR